jgi:Sap, sulfolipid-1-addressing protein
VIFSLFLLSIAIAFEPFPIIGFILLIVAKDGQKKALAFLCGWMASLIVVVVGVVLVTGGQPVEKSSSPSLAALIFKLLIGIFLIFWGIRAYVNRKKPPKPPSWMAKIDGVQGWAAAALGVILQPWAFVAAGVAIVFGAELKSLGEIVVLVLFVLLSSSSFLAMLIYVTFWSESAGPKLERLRLWIDSHRIQAQFVLCILIGLWLIGNSTYSLTTI